MENAIGIFQRTKRGFGFVTVDKLEEDIFIPSKKSLGAMNGDVVEIEYSLEKEEGKRLEGKVVDIVERKTSEVVGVYKDYSDFGFVEVEDVKLSEDIFISKKMKGTLTAKDGQVVVAKITKYSTGTKKSQGVITEILGFPEEAGVEISTIVKRFNLNTEFNEKVIEEVSSISQTVEKSSLKNRVDLRDEIIITIDGEDSKDLDDAISIKLLDNGNFYLGVHIADVTHYVKEKSHLDKEAYARATSVYLIDEVIPMLPKELSNGICSLNPGVDRLTLSCFMEINKQGKVVKKEIVESVINSTERMTYKNVSKLLRNEDAELAKRYSHILEHLFLMEKLQNILYKKRMDRGSLDFEFKESKIELDENRKPVSITAYERDISNRIIEEFMLVANETIAEEFCKLKIPFVYRIHERPKIEKFESLNEFLVSLGENAVKEEHLNPKYLQAIVQKYKDTEEEQIINMLILRSLMKAKYSSMCVNHFGLNADYYCHFTSPIRRYPDLQIHRIIKKVINNNMDAKYKKKLEKRVEFASIQSSERELVAQEAEKEVHRFKKAEFMMNKIGEEFEGVVSSATRFGLFVQLENTVEGLVTLDSLDDDVYVYDEKKFNITGLSTEKVYKVGTPVKVKVKSVDMKNREIFFSLIVDSDNIEVA